MSFILKKIDQINRSTVEYFIILSLAVVFIVRSSFPSILNYPYYILLIIGVFFFIYSGFNQRTTILSFNYKFLKEYYIVFILFVFSSVFNFNHFIIKEVFKSLVVLFIINMIFLNVKKIDDFKRFQLNIVKYTFLIISLIVTLIIIGNTFWSNLFHLLNIKKGFSFTSDYNVYSLTLFIGLVFLMVLINQKNSKFKILIYSFIFFLIPINIFFTSSRRGLMLLVIFFFSLLLINIYIIKNKLIKFKEFLKNSIYLVGIYFIFLFFLFFLFIHISPVLKHQILFKHNISNETRINIAYPLSRYTGMNYNNSYNFFWNNDYNGIVEKVWCRKIQNFIDILFIDDNLNFIKNPNFQNGSSGFLNWGNSELFLYENYIDSSNLVIVKGNSINDGIAAFLNVPTNIDLILQANVNVIKWNSNLRIMTLSCGKYISQGIPRSWEGDSLWHKIEITANYCEEDAPMFFILGGSNLNESISLWTNLKAKLAYNNINSNFNDFNKLTESDSLIINLDYDSLSNNENIIPFQIRSQKKLIRTLNIKKEEERINENLEKDKYRYKHWGYAFHIWYYDYSILKKIFGNGFVYLEKYGEKFYNSPKRYDYPHNPILSALLYSGIIGVILYIYFLVIVFINYWKYRKYHMTFFIIYLISFFFIMFSGNSHFSLPVFNLFSLVPFLSKYYLLKNKKLIIR